MITKKTNRIFILTGILLLVILQSFATPIGANMYNPINAGTLNAGNTYTDSKNNSPANG